MEELNDISIKSNLYVQDISPEYTVFISKDRDFNKVELYHKENLIGEESFRKNWKFKNLASQFDWTTNFCTLEEVESVL